MPRVGVRHVVACGFLVLGAVVPAGPVSADEPSAWVAGETMRGGSPAVEADSLRELTPPATGPKATPSATVRPFSFTAHRLDRCRYFMILEVSGSKVAIQTQDKGDQFIVTHALGVMKNLDSRWAVGAAIEAHWSWGFVKFTPAVRARRWFGREQSLEGSFGYITSMNVRDYGGEMVGPIATLRYSPTPLVFAQAGISGFRQHDIVYVPATGRIIESTRDSTKPFGGVGFTAGYGLVILGAELVTFAVLLALFAGMS